ncbi:MAG: hypothetical protein NTNFB02_15460 [Nitrospira sp.]
MNQVMISRKAIAFMLCVCVVSLIPWIANARYRGQEKWADRHSDITWRVDTVVAMYSGFEGWEEQLTGFVIVQAGIASAKGEAASFDPYLGQVELVRSLYNRGDWKGTYAAMNHFMDMLEAREGSISAQAADAIWDLCYAVTPPALHDVKRHRQWWDKTVDWEKFFWEE